MSFLWRGQTRTTRCAPSSLALDCTQSFAQFASPNENFSQHFNPFGEQTLVVCSARTQTNVHVHFREREREREREMDARRPENEKSQNKREVARAGSAQVPRPHPSEKPKFLPHSRSRLKSIDQSIDMSKPSYRNASLGLLLSFLTSLPSFSFSFDFDLPAKIKN